MARGGRIAEAIGAPTEPAIVPTVLPPALMWVRALALFLLGTLLATSLPPPSRAQSESREGEGPDAEQAARTAVRGWLNHVDADAWSAAWKDAAPALREATGKERWTKSGTRAREVLGALRSRRLEQAQYRDTLRQGPSPPVAGSGPFVLLRYRSEFEAGLYVETVLATKKDETWRVASYEVAPVAVLPTKRENALWREDGS